MTVKIWMFSLGISPRFLSLLRLRHCFHPPTIGSSPPPLFRYVDTPLALFFVPFPTPSCTTRASSNSTYYRTRRCHCPHSLSPSLSMLCDLFLMPPPPPPPGGGQAPFFSPRVPPSTDTHTSPGNLYALEVSISTAPRVLTYFGLPFFSVISECFIF